MTTSAPDSFHSEARKPFSFEQMNTQHWHTGTGTLFWKAVKSHKKVEKTLPPENKILLFCDAAFSHSKCLHCLERRGTPSTWQTCKSPSNVLGGRRGIDSADPHGGPGVLCGGWWGGGQGRAGLGGQGGAEVLHPQLGLPRPRAWAQPHTSSCRVAAEMPDKWLFRSTPRPKTGPGRRDFRIIFCINFCDILAITFVQTGREISAAGDKLGEKELTSRAKS